MITLNDIFIPEYTEYWEKNIHDMYWKAYNLNKDDPMKHGLMRIFRLEIDAQYVEGFGEL